MKKIIILVTIISISGVCFSQSLSRNDFRFLYQAIEIFIGDREPKIEKTWERNSEFFFCFLEIDSVGKVKDVRLFSNDKNHDSTYTILSQMKPNIFEKWKANEKCRNKTVMIPIYSYSRDGKTANDVMSLSQFYYRIPAKVIEENKNVVVGSLLTYNAPHAIRESLPNSVINIKVAPLEKSHKKLPEE